MKGKLSSRTAIITGSSSGIGRAIALTYAREGAIVVCADLSPYPSSKISPSENTKAEETTLEPPTHELIVKNGGQAIFVKTDVENERDLKEVIRICVQRWGKLDMYVCSFLFMWILGMLELEKRGRIKKLEGRG